MNQYDKSERTIFTEAAEWKSENKRLKTVFHAADLNEDGRISKEELQRILSVVGEWTPEDFTKLFNDADVDNNGFLDIDEFIDWLLPQNIVHKTMLIDDAEAIKSIFDQFDTDGSEFISKQELQEGIRQKILDGLLPEMYMQYFLVADQSCNGRISLGEFRAWIEKTFPKDEWCDPDLLSPKKSGCLTLPVE